MLDISSARPLLKLIAVATMLSGSLFLTQNAAAAAAGKVVFATGTTTAISDTGVSRALRRGDEIFSGDKLMTAKRSRLQVSLADGAYVSIQPDSEYKIEDYHFSGKNDGAKRAFYRLLKGGIRAVTGLIGKKNRDAYRVSTAVATIGIRGTGHNTRICAGDCPGEKDGLYHNTWEGVTIVTNDVDSKEVPTGKGVFVKDIHSDIQSLNQPSSVTAVETTKKAREEQKQDEQRSTLASSGDQRSGDDGLQKIVVEDQEVRDALDKPYGDPTFSTVKEAQLLLAVSPDFDVSDQVAIFRTVDSQVFENSEGKTVAVFGTDKDEDTAGNINFLRVFATIDPAAALGVEDDVLAQDVLSFLDAADPGQVDFFLEKPAQVAEFNTTPAGISMGRWANGRVLSVDQSLDTGQFNATLVEELDGFQSIHFIYGDTPGPLPVSGSANYSFVAGTRSTSLSGTSIGDGVLAGSNLFVDFSSSSAFIDLDVQHDNILYDIQGPLIVDGASLFDTSSVTAQNLTDMSGACYPGCQTFIEGTFIGPSASGMPGIPNNVGIEYEIQETDIITGVAGFSYGAGP